MARRFVDYTIRNPNEVDQDGKPVPWNSRDEGKTYRIREMSASAGEEWALRAFLALAGAGIDIPEEVTSQGLAGLAVQGMASMNKLPWEIAKPLLDEMMACVSFLAPAAERPLIETDIEEIKTRLILRKEVLKLHTDFLRSAAGLT